MNLRDALEHSATSGNRFPKWDMSEEGTYK